METPRISQNEVWLSSGSGFRHKPRLRRLKPQVPQLSGPPFGIGTPRADVGLMRQHSTRNRLRRESVPCNLLPERKHMLYPGETVRLLRELPESALPQYMEGSVVSVLQDTGGEPLAAEVRF